MRATPIPQPPPQQSTSIFYLNLFAFLRSIYIAAITPSYPKFIRNVCLCTIVITFTLRSLALWRTTALQVLPIPLLLASFFWGILPALALVTILCIATISILALTHPGDGLGHRAGAKAFAPPEFATNDEVVVENTVQSLKALAEADKAGAFDDKNTHFPYVEFDVQETKDGALVVFHDYPHINSGAFPAIGSNIKALERLKTQGIHIETASIQDFTLNQLKTLCLGGKDGVHVPTLEEFFQACVEYDVQRTLAVEVKALKTDAARARLLSILTSYIETQGKKLDAMYPPPHTRQYRPLGWCGIIAFPHYFAASFGEFGTDAWRGWASEMKQRGIPARCVHFHYLDFTYGC